MYSIGNEIHVITFEKEYVISNNDEKELEKVLHKQVNLSSTLKAFPIERKVLSNRLAEKSNKSLSSESKIIFGSNNSVMWTDDRSAIEPECGAGGRPERVRLEAFVHNYVSYGAIGVRIKGEAYRKGGLWGRRDWRNDEVLYGKIEGKAKFTFAGGIFE